MINNDLGVGDLPPFFAKTMNNKGEINFFGAALLIWYGFLCLPVIIAILIIVNFLELLLNIIKKLKHGI